MSGGKGPSYLEESEGNREREDPWSFGKFDTCVSWKRLNREASGARTAYFRGGKAKTRRRK